MQKEKAERVLQYLIANKLAFCYLEYGGIIGRENCEEIIASKKKYYTFSYN